MPPVRSSTLQELELDQVHVRDGHYEVMLPYKFKTSLTSKSDRLGLPECLTHCMQLYLQHRNELNHPTSVDNKFLFCRGCGKRHTNHSLLAVFRHFGRSFCGEPCVAECGIVCNVVSHVLHLHLLLMLLLLRLHQASLRMVYTL